MKTNSKLIITLFVGVLMGALDISIVGPAIPSIEKSVLIPQNDIGWIFSIYVLFNLVGISLFARLSDLFGRRSIYMTAVFIFLIGSLWVAMSHSYSSILIGRSIQGFGASGIFPVASAVIGDKFPVEQRGRMLGLIGMVFGIAFILGPIIAGIILSFTSWNWLFFINLPLAIFLLFYSWKYLPSEPTSQVFKLDWKGVITMGIALGFFTLAINSIDVKNILSSITNTSTLIFFAIAFISAFAFLYFEYREPQPIVNIRHFKRKQVSIASALAIGTGFFQALFSFLPKLAVGTLHLSPAKASFLLVPSVFSAAIGSPIFGRMLDKLGSRIVIFIGMTLMLAGLLVAVFIADSFVLYFTSGVFIGLAFSVLSGSALRYIVLNEVPAADRASGQGLITIFINVGQMVNATILGGIIAGGTSLLSGYHNVFLFLSVVAFFLLIASWFLKKKEAA